MGILTWLLDVSKDLVHCEHAWAHVGTCSLLKEQFCLYIMMSIYSVDELASILEAPVDHRQLALHVSNNAWLCYYVLSIIGRGFVGYIYVRSSGWH